MKTQNHYDHPHNLVYCKPGKSMGGDPIIEVWGSQGAFLTYFLHYETAFASARQNDLIPVYVH